METITTGSLLRKSTAELWRIRQQVVTDLQALDGSDSEAEEHLSKNLQTVDGAMDERMRQESVTGRYGHLLNGGGHDLSQRDKSADQWLRSAILEKNPAAHELLPEEERSFTASYPGLEYRDIVSSTPTQAIPRSVYDQFMIHLVELTPVMRAGALVITTRTGEDLLVPKTTAYQTSNLMAEGAQITESDATLAAVTLKAYKYAAFWQIGRELAEDSPANLLDSLARTAAASLAVAYGAHLATGTGTGQPQGYTVGAGVGVTGPTGTSTTFGSQGTAGQGSDLLFDLYTSIAEPYLLSDAVAVLGRNSTYTQWRKVREGTTNKPMFDLTPTVPGASVNLLGQKGFVDPNTPTPAANAKSLAYGDWSRFAVRIVQGVRLERSDEFAFQNDLVSFKATIRLDGALIDTNAVKLFQHSAT